jgi:hypothetical protein
MLEKLVAKPFNAVCQLIRLVVCKDCGDRPFSSLFFEILIIFSLEFARSPKN